MLGEVLEIFGLAARVGPGRPDADDEPVRRAPTCVALRPGENPKQRL